MLCYPFKANNVSVELYLLSFSRWGLLGLFFGHEEGGDMFLQNVR
jgi:hypothetical protein